MTAARRFAAAASGLAAALMMASAVPGTASAVAASASAASAGAAGAGAAGAGAAAAATASRILPPHHRGTLRVTGRLADGGTVTAAGLRWEPGRLPRGDRLLSFEVGYNWSTCPKRGHCATAADSTATPFAAGHYLVGHADTGKRLRVTVTATEVVETDPATFSFSVVRAAVSRMTSTAAGAFPAGRPPVTEFVNGTPEHRTASAQEYFGVDPPHYNLADGPASQWYRIDRRPWRAMPASRVFYTGSLGTGPHQVTVRTADQAGARFIRFVWTVVPMPAPVPCRPAVHRSCWYPPHLAANNHPMRWDWQIGRVSPLQRTGARAVDIYDIDGFLTTSAQVRAIHTSWQASTLPHPKAICYLDLAWEDYRPDGSLAPRGSFPADTLGNIYFGFSQERWVDLRQLDALKPMLDERIAMCARKGFDAVELDDIDSFDPPSTTGFHLTPGDAQNFLAYAFNEIHRLGMTGLWKNSPYLTWWARSYADGAIVEECYLGHACFASWLRGSRQYGITCTSLAGATPCGWDDFTTDKTSPQPTGKWVGEAEYSADRFVCNPAQRCSHKREFATFCSVVYGSAGGFAAVKFDADLDGRLFYPCPRGR